MTLQLKLCAVFYLTSVSLAFPGYFEEDDEEDKQYSHPYADQYFKLTTPSLTPPMDSTEPTVDMDKTLQLFTHYADHTSHEPRDKETVQLFTNHAVYADHELRDTKALQFTYHKDQEPRRRKRYNKPKRRNVPTMDHAGIKELLGGNFMYAEGWTVTETRVIEFVTDSPPQNIHSYLTSVTASRTPEGSFVAHSRTNLPENSEESEAKPPELAKKRKLYVFHDWKQDRTEPIRTSRLDPNDLETVQKQPPQRQTRLNLFLIKRLGPLGNLKGLEVTEEEDATLAIPHSFSASEDLRTVPFEGSHSTIVRQGGPVVSSAGLPSVLPTIEVTDNVKFDYDVPQSLQDIQASPVMTTPFTYFTHQGSPHRVTEKGSTEGLGIARRMDLSTLPQSYSTHPLQIMVNGTMMDWRQAIALRKGEYFDMKKFWRDRIMTTRRSRVYVFVTQGNVYRVCVLQDYKSLIVSCSIDNAMTICVKALYVTNKIFENEQGVRYNGSIVPCPVAKTLRHGETTEPTGVYTQICVNRRRTEFKIRCPPEGAHWTSQTRCIDNFRRAPWRGPFDYMFGEAWVGTTVTCPEVSTTEQRYFYITMTCATTSYPILDVEGLLALVANLTYDYEEDLVAKLNKSLYIFLSPPTPVTTTPATTTVTTTLPFYEDVDDHETGDIIYKCYHCGMDEYEIPYSAACNDAFATEIMELMPVKAQARQHLASFRKYCRYNMETSWSYNASDIRSVYGRWSHGCSVRWIDISGIYTERTCRNKERPAMGHSFASRRLAKLELALKSVDSGCITSPMAVLVPLSRAISLYARFHSCVCLGSFCNAAVAARAHWAMMLAVAIGRWHR